MKLSELLELKCGDIIQCKNHPKIKGKSVEIAEFDKDSPKESLCGCHYKYFEVVKN